MDQAIKQRLVGVMVLGSLALILVPFLFQGSRQYQVDHTPTIPPPPSFDPPPVAAPNTVNLPTNDIELEAMFKANPTSLDE